MKKAALILTCEHAVNDIPAHFLSYFVEQQAVLSSHRGIDFGALRIAEELGLAFNCPVFSATVSRLLIDYNRSLSHPHCFSEISARLSVSEKKELVQEYYLPYREKVEAYIQAKVNQGFQVWHLSIHSFVPILDGITRNAELGLLYDPKRSTEKAMALQWQRLLKKSTAYRVRLNYPYRGNTDGFTTYLRKQFAELDYLGIEVEANQNLVVKPELSALITHLKDTIPKFF